MRSEDADQTACLIRMITLIVGACAAVLALVAVTIYARKALKEALVVRTKYFGCIITAQLYIQVHTLYFWLSKIIRVLRTVVGSFHFGYRSLFLPYLPATVFGYYDILRSYKKNPAVVVIHLFSAAV